MRSSSGIIANTASMSELLPEADDDCTTTAIWKCGLSGVLKVPPM
jgi:hypothetical protein